MFYQHTSGLMTKRESKLIQLKYYVVILIIKSILNIQMANHSIVTLFHCNIIDQDLSYCNIIKHDLIPL